MVFVTKIVMTVVCLAGFVYAIGCGAAGMNWATRSQYPEIVAIAAVIFSTTIVVGCWELLKHIWLH